RWYSALQPKTRIIIGAGIMAHACAAMYLSDKLDEQTAIVYADEDFAKIRAALPTITTVERK
ncbi:hypothetical protein BDU57DRAFT_421347, partial [Ampelomyces quisqualis]